MDKLKYSLLTTKDIPSTINCVVKVFLYDEPMTKSLNITEFEFKIFATSICNKCAKEKLSYTCTDNHNKIVGFCLNEDLISEEGLSFDNVTKKMDPIFNILEVLDSSYLNDKQKTRNLFFHLFMVGSLSEYRNKGIARKLIEKSLVLAKKRKYKIVLTEATNLKSQNLLKKFNFEEVRKINYSKFKFNNNPVFKDIGEEYCKLMELKLS